VCQKSLAFFGLWTAFLCRFGFANVSALRNVDELRNSHSCSARNGDTYCA
jgi:hypothetical protein